MCIFHLYKFHLVICVPSLYLYCILIFLAKSLSIFIKAVLSPCMPILSSLLILDLFILTNFFHVYGLPFFPYVTNYFWSDVGYCQYYIVDGFHCLPLTSFEYSFVIWLSNLHLNLILLRLGFVVNSYIYSTNIYYDLLAHHMISLMLLDDKGV